MKQISLISLMLLLAACSAKVKDDGCPDILVPRETARLYQNNGRYDEFQVNMLGAESYCYTEPSNNRRYAVITPIFKVRRLEDSSVTTLDADFYIKTSKNSEDYLGTRKFSQSLTIPTSEKEKIIKGRRTLTRISNPPYDGFTISVGMAMSENAKGKAKSMFDINYRYLSAEDIAADSENDVNTVYLEVASDEEVIYSDYDQKPVVVKKNRKKSNCQN